MKSLIVLFLLVLSAPISFAQGGGGEKGGSVGNGGEGDVGPAATQIAVRLAMEEINGNIFIPHSGGYSPNGDRKANVVLGPMLRFVKIESTNQALMMENGVEVDAKNFPAEKTIIFNTTRWNSRTCKQQYLLVLHEFLGVAGIESSQNYLYSSTAINSLFYAENDDENMLRLCPVK